MKYMLAAFTFISIASAQVPQGQGYLVQGIGAATPGSVSLAQTVVGGEGTFFKGLGAGAEIGALYSFDGGVVGQFNAGGTYHFTAGRKETKWDPFVAAGYAMLFRSGTISGFHYGGGTGYWFHPRIGLRAEFRDLRFERGRDGYPGFRIGICFR
jgi:hypothetical protein